MITWLGALASQSAPLAAQEPGLTFPQNVNPAIITMKPITNGKFVRSWDSGTITCNGDAVAAAEWIAPHSQFAPKKLLKFPVTIGFAIDATGRALDIRVLEGGYVEGKFEIDAQTSQINTQRLFEALAVRDLMPSLRASRFAQGAPKANCRVDYTPRYDDAAGIGRDPLARIAAVPGFKITAALSDQLGGGDCNTVGWPAPLLRGFPDFRKVSAREGVRTWTWIRLDIDEAGAPINPTVIASSGDATLDAEGLRAYRVSRFAGGPRTGCVAVWWRDPGLIPAPPAPENCAFPGHRSCAALRSWNTKPKLTYPQAYNERQIEGWAVLGFDIAADGSIGNVNVLAAQPSEEFGTAGAAVLQSGRFAAGDEALTNCIEQVRFVTEKKAAPAGDS
jgi:hypothetical protein